MKTSTNPSAIKISSNLIVVFFLSLIMVSCNNKVGKNQTVNYSENGIKLSSKLVSVNEDLDSIIDAQDFQKELIKILNDVSPETYIMKVGQDKKENQMEHFYTLNAFRSLEKVFIAYNLQLDANISTQASDLKDKINVACNALDSVNLSETLKLNNEKIKLIVNSNKFRVDETIFQLTNLYSQFWGDEGQKWIAFLETNHETIRKGIESISVTAFNTEKIKDLVDEPYANGAVLANLYKLKLIKENQQFTKDLENNINAISDAFNVMLQIQGELMKRTRSETKIQELNSSLELLLIN